MKLLPALLIGIVLSLWISARADSLKDIPPPTAPFVAAVPDSADWTVSVKNAGSGTSKTASGAANHALATITEVHSTKTGKIKRDVSAYSDGTKSTRWFVDMLLLWTTQEGEVSATDLRAAPAVDPRDDSPSVASGFPGLAWLKLEYYEKPVLVETRPCYHFVHEGNEAWVDVETKMPVSYKNGTRTYTFKFAEPPAEPLVLPPNFQKAWEQCQKIFSHRQMLMRPPVVNR